MSIVRLNLRGTHFVLHTDDFSRHPDSLLGRAFHDGAVMRPADMVDGAYYFSRDPEIFKRVILGMYTYTYGYWNWLPSDDPAMLYQELCFWGLAPISEPKPGEETGSVEVCVAHMLCKMVDYEWENNRRLLNEYIVQIDDRSEGFHASAHIPSGVTAVIGRYNNLIRSVALCRGVALEMNDALEGRIEYCLLSDEMRIKDMPLSYITYDDQRDGLKIAEDHFVVLDRIDDYTLDLCLGGETFVVKFARNRERDVHECTVTWPPHSETRWRYGHHFEVHRGPGASLDDVMGHKMSLCDWGEFVGHISDWIELDNAENAKYVLCVDEIILGVGEVLILHVRTQEPIVEATRLTRTFHLGLKVGNSGRAVRVRGYKL